MPFYRCPTGGVKHVDLDLGNVYIDKDTGKVISLSYDNNIFIHAIGIDLVMAYPQDSFAGCGVVVLDKHNNTSLSVRSLVSQNYHIIVRVYYQD